MSHISKSIHAALFFCLLSSGTAFSNPAVDGMLLGAGGGALIGQAVGRNTQSTIIGGAIGGTVGLLANSGPVVAQPAFYGGPPMPPPPHPVFIPPPPVMLPPPPPPPPQPVRYGREYFRGHEVCVDTIWERPYYGRMVQEVTTRCWPRRHHDYYGPDWRYRHRHWQD